MSRIRFHRTLLSLLAALVATALMAVPLGPPGALAAKPKPKPKVTKIKHLGSFDEFPGSQVSFTLIKRGRVLIKAVNIQVSGINLFCSDGHGNFSDSSYATTFPNMRVGRNPFGQVGFAVSEIPLPEFEWGYKSFAAFLRDHGRSASGDARIRWGQGEAYCGGQVVTWTSQAI